jgi:hypothetical protein
VAAVVVIDLFTYDPSVASFIFLLAVFLTRAGERQDALMATLGRQPRSTR